MPSGRSHAPAQRPRSEEHTSELQSRSDLVCRLLLEKKKKNTTLITEADSQKIHLLSDTLRAHDTTKLNTAQETTATDYAPIAPTDHISAHASYTTFDLVVSSHVIAVTFSLLECGLRHVSV